MPPANLKEKRKMSLTIIHTRGVNKARYNQQSVSVQNAGFTHKTCKDCDPFNLLILPASYLVKLNFSPMRTCLAHQFIAFAMDMLFSATPLNMLLTQNKTLKRSIITKLRSGVSRNEYRHVVKWFCSDTARVSIIL